MCEDITIVSITTYFHDIFNQQIIINPNIDIMYFFPLLKQGISTSTILLLLLEFIRKDIIILDAIIKDTLAYNSINITEKVFNKLTKEHSLAVQLRFLYNNLYLAQDDLTKINKFNIYDLGKVFKILTSKKIIIIDNTINIIEELSKHPKIDPLSIYYVSGKEVPIKYLNDPRSNKFMVYTNLDKTIESDIILKQQIEQILITKLTLWNYLCLYNNLPQDIYRYIISLRML